MPCRFRDVNLTAGEKKCTQHLRRTLQAGFFSKATWLCGAILFSLGLGPQAIAASPGDEVIEEVVVTGSYIKRTSLQDSASPLTNVDRQSIDDTGILTSQEIFRWLPSNTGSEKSGRRPHPRRNARHFKRQSAETGSGFNAGFAQWPQANGFKRNCRPG